jgi:hypothetical protein
MAPIGYSGAGGKLIHEKSLKSKISGKTPFSIKSGKGDYMVFCVVTAKTRLIDGRCYLVL